MCITGKSEVLTVMEDKHVTVIPVIGMTCLNCVSKIESNVAKLSSVVSVKVIMHFYFMYNFFPAVLKHIKLSLYSFVVGAARV